MAAEHAVPATELRSDGPPQVGRGVRGQYCYWITMPMLRQEDLLTHGLKKPSEFSREGFIELGVKVHRECGIDVVEAICFLEPHEDGQPHMNLLVRSSRQFRWLPVAQR